jgi:hypothetical protein
MGTDISAQPSVQTPVSPVDEIDPHGYLQPQMRVIGGQSLALGKVDSFERDATGLLTSLTVRHGLFGNKRTIVPVKQIKWVNQDSVVLQLSRAAFKRLPQVAR